MQLIVCGFPKAFGVSCTAIHNLANNYREDFKFPNLKLTFKNRQGFHFVIPQKNIQGKLPNKFIQVRDWIFVATFLG